MDGRKFLAELAQWQSFVQRPACGHKCWDRTETAYFVICVGAVFVFSVAVTTGSAAGGGMVSRGGTAGRPQGDVRAKVAAALDVSTVSTLFNTDKLVNTRWR